MSAFSACCKVIPSCPFYLRVFFRTNYCKQLSSQEFPGRFCRKAVSSQIKMGNEARDQFRTFGPLTHQPLSQQYLKIIKMLQVFSLVWNMQESDILFLHIWFQTYQFFCVWNSRRLRSFSIKSKTLSMKRKIWLRFYGFFDITQRFTRFNS